MTRTLRWMLVAGLVAVIAMSSIAGAQTPPPAQDARGQRNPAGRPGGRAGLPPVTSNMTPQQLQSYIDAFAIVEAERQLQLSAEQYGAFVPRLVRLQNVRRRHIGERRRLLDELGGLLRATPAKDEAITEKLRALNEAGPRAHAELQKAYEEIDSLLTPVQRGQLRMFDERLERRKIELLGKIAAPPPPGRGGGF